MIPIKTDYDLNDLSLQKFAAIKKAENLIDFIDKNNKPMIRTASSNPVDTNQLLSLFTQMLACLNLKSDVNVQDLLSKISNSTNPTDLTKTATIKKSSDKKDDIKIVSKMIRDSHYQIDISKDAITKQGKKLFMVSCYARDAYLGRYLIKRNYYFTADREASADNAYDEIFTKMAAIKERYYNEVIDVSSISTQFKKILDGVVSEIQSQEEEK